MAKKVALTNVVTRCTPGPSTGAADQLAVQRVRLPVDNLFYTTQVLSGWLGTAFPAGGRLCCLPGSSPVALVRWLQASPKCVKPRLFSFHTLLSPTAPVCRAGSRPFLGREDPPAVPIPSCRMWGLKIFVFWLISSSLLLQKN